MPVTVDWMLLSAHVLPPSVRALRPWQRFHVRITLLYGAAVVAVFAILGAVLYDAGVDAEISGLQLRLRAMVALLAADLKPQAVEALKADGSEAEEVRRALSERAATLCAHDPDVSSAYVLLRTLEPGVLRFAMTYNRVQPPEPL